MIPDPYPGTPPGRVPAADEFAVARFTDAQQPALFSAVGVGGDPEAPEVVTFTVAGRPSPQGSKSAQSHCGQVALVCGRCRKPHIVKINQVEKSKYVKAWRKAVTAAAKPAMRGLPPITGPVKASMIFALDRPKNHYLHRKTGDVLHPDAPAWPSGRGMSPDLSKLIRATEDALTGVVWEDDAQVVCYQDTCMVWAQDRPMVHFAPPAAGVTITVRRMPG